MFRPKSQLSQEFTDDWVSVVIPTYNRANMLSEALESVRQQTYRPIEIIILDDGSTDSTRAMVEAFSNEYSSADFKLKYFYQLNRNASACRNLGLLNSVGEFIQFLDSDDYLHPYKLESQVAKLRDLKLDFVWSSTIMFEQEVDWSASVYVGHPLDEANKTALVVDFINKSQWRTESGLFTRRACVKTGWWSAISMFQDWEYHIRMLSWLPNTAFVTGAFSAARQHQAGRIGDRWQNGTGLAGALQALKTIAQASEPACRNNSDWHTAICSRGEEIQQQAIKTNHLDVAEAAAQFVTEFCHNSRLIST